MSQFPWRQRAAWWMAAHLAPWLRSSQESYFERVEQLIRPGIRILDLGCGKEFLMGWLRPDLYRKWSKSITENAAIFGIDPYFPSLQANRSRSTACALASRLPFAAASFDLVTANMVVEHLEQPDPVLRDVFRVLRPNGALIFHTPNLRSPVIRISHLLPHRWKQALVPIVEGGRQQEDVFETHYRLNTRQTIAEAAARCSFECESVEHVFTAPLTQFAGPLVAFELLAIQVLRGERFAGLRPDLICVLRRGQSGPNAKTAHEERFLGPLSHK